jgi:adenylosuccinate synthase
VDSHIVLGAGYGDECKGHVVSYLVDQFPSSIVIRFNGGHQAGHTVVVDDRRHVFSSFGSGTLQGAPTVWSRFCTFNPVAVMNELEILLPKLHSPHVRIARPGTAALQLLVDPLSPVTTPYDIYMNQVSERRNGHGSVGVGFGTTVARHEDHVRLYFQDLFLDNVLIPKLEQIGKYWLQRLPEGHKPMTSWPSAITDALDEFMEAVLKVRRSWVIGLFDRSYLQHYSTLIFEGAQGILLDQNFGFFPHVTRSNTTSQNALTLMDEWGIDGNIDTEVIYTTRAYQTRHGTGPLSNTALPLVLTNTEQETNQIGKWQGLFRTSVLDSDLLRYAMMCDRQVWANTHSAPLPRRRHSTLAVNCLDQTGDAFPVTAYSAKTAAVQADALMLASMLDHKPEWLITSHAADLSRMKRVKT